MKNTKETGSHCGGGKTPMDCEKRNGPKSGGFTSLSTNGMTPGGQSLLGGNWRDRKLLGLRFSTNPPSPCDPECSGACGASAGSSRAAMRGDTLYLKVSASHYASSTSGVPDNTVSEMQQGQESSRLSHRPVS